MFPDKPYVSLEDLDMREFAQTDPRGFLDGYPQGAILDEIQRAPELFSYLQTLVDQKQKQGMFILTGSHHFLLMETLSQTLAGRVRILNLLPFSLEELETAHLAPASLEKMIFKGMYPRLYDKKIAPVDWYPDYLRTYIERDVRLLKNISDLSLFQKFLKLCAARIGQLLNLSNLAEECGITHNTAKSWLGILEASFIVHLLKPHYRNFNKRIVKLPKLYFYDTGLVGSLLEIESEKQLQTHPLRGSLFEAAILSELIKYRMNRGLPLNLHFWRDKTGHEIDCVIERGETLVPVEIKSSQTVNEELLKNLKYWVRISLQKKMNAFLIYSGDAEQKRQGVTILGWKKVLRIFSRYP